VDGTNSRVVAEGSRTPCCETSSVCHPAAAAIPAKCHRSDDRPIGSTLSATAATSSIGGVWSSFLCDLALSL
jgi:hypothetical protein